MNGAARFSRQAARQQLFQAEEVCLEGRREGALPHPMCQLCMCLWRRCVCLSICVWKCASVSVNSACLCELACTLLSLSLPVCVIWESYRSKQHPGAVWFLNHRKELNNLLGFFYFFLQNPQHLLITSQFWCSVGTSQWGYYPNKWFCEVYSNSNGSSK